MPEAIPCEPPDVPVFNLDEVHRMQAGLWQHAQRVLGPCTHHHTVAPARFHTGDEACAFRDGNAIEIRLELNAARDWASCAAILGHELVHALDGLTGPTSWLEEGVGCLFGISQCAAMFDDVPKHLCRGAYLHAMRLTASIPHQFDVVKALRAQGIRMCKVTPAQLMAAAPGVDAETAHALCAQFRPEPIIARVHDHGR